jgi:hypothetical protein
MDEYNDNDDFSALRNTIHTLKSEINDLRQLVGFLKNEINQSRNEVKLSRSGMHKLSSNFLFNNNIASYKTPIVSLTKEILNKIIAGARANGGNVAGGAPYLVGENGPEVFIPHSGGYINNNNSTKANNIKIEMHINTSDMGSFQKSKNQIIAEVAGRIAHATRNL